MTDHVYKLMEIIGTSNTSLEDAINEGVARAGAKTDNLRWFDVGQIRGGIEGRKVTHWQVSLTVGYSEDVLQPCAQESNYGRSE